MFYRSVITMRVYLKAVSLQVTRKMVYIDGISFGLSPSFPAIVPPPPKKKKKSRRSTRYERSTHWFRYSRLDRLKELELRRVLGKL